MRKNKIRLDEVSLNYGNGCHKPRFNFWNGRRPNGNSASKTVLEDISLDIQAGEFVCFLGHSGCGKSTLLQVIAGFKKPSRGTVWIDDTVVNGPRADHVFVFQQGALFPWLTIAENVALALRSTKDPKERLQKAEYYLELVALEGVCDHYPYMLSGGMSQRAEIARALAAKPDILLMDEPFSGLDYLTRLHLREEMVNLHMMLQETTILFVTHDIDEALQLSNRLVILTDPPAKIKCCHTIDVSHPRTLTSPTLGEMRSLIYHHLGVHTAI